MGCGCCIVTTSVCDGGVCFCVHVTSQLLTLGMLAGMSIVYAAAAAAAAGTGFSV